MDKSLWWEVLTKEAKEFGDPLSTFIIMNEQGNYCVFIFEQQQENFSLVTCELTLRNTAKIH